MPLYYADDLVQLHHGDCRDILLTLDIAPDLIVADPPYGETSLAWDRWPAGWVAVVTDVCRSMWCFGSMRVWLHHAAEFTATGWRLSQDVIWEKQNGSGFATDRFRRVHEHVTHWYRGPWSSIHHEVPRVPATRTRGGNGRRAATPHTGAIAPSPYVDDGMRLVRSVIWARSANHYAIHRTEKPVELLRPLIAYGCPPGGIVCDPFAGSASTAVAARQLGRRAVLIEADEAMCELAARRLSQQPLPLEVT